ncbi:MAG: MFS transporter, partial [Hyphomicrobium sp.]
GSIYFVFLPSIFTTLCAGAVQRRIGARLALLLGLAVAAMGLPLLLSSHLSLLLAGMALIASGTFFAQAVATSFVSRSAMFDRAAASGIYLASYFIGGLIGTAVLGRAFEAFGWPATVAGVGAALVTAMLLSFRLERAPANSKDASPLAPDTPKL